MPARMDHCGNVELPRGDTFGFLLSNCGTHKLTDNDTAVLVVINETGAALLRKEVHAEGGMISIQLTAEDTLGLPEGAHMYDITITTAETESEMPLRKSVFAPQLRRFVVGRIADGQVW